jgi:hypothetical protein
VFFKKIMACWFEILVGNGFWSVCICHVFMWKFSILTPAIFPSTPFVVCLKWTETLSWCFCVILLGSHWATKPKASLTFDSKWLRSYVTAINALEWTNYLDFSEQRGPVGRELVESNLNDVYSPCGGSGAVCISFPNYYAFSKHFWEFLFFVFPLFHPPLWINTVLFWNSGSFFELETQTTVFILGSPNFGELSTCCYTECGVLVISWQLPLLCF